MLRRAILVGCSEYQDPDVANLNYAHSDARKLRDTLIATGGFEPEDISLLVTDVEDLEPTRDKVIDILAGLSEEEQPELLLFFFSGHGFSSSSQDEDYLLLSNSNLKVPELTSLSISDLLKLLRQSLSKFLVLFIDACRDAHDSKGVARLNKIGQSTLNVRGAVTFCSCESGQLSYEHPELEAGLFTYVLLKALSDDGKCVTVGEVDEYLRREAPLLSRRLGRRRQTPETSVDPLQLQSVELVSPAKRNEWRAMARIGSEHRDWKPSMLQIDLPKT